MAATSVRDRLNRGIVLDEGQILTPADVPSRDERLAETRAAADAEAKRAAKPIPFDPGIVLEAPVRPTSQLDRIEGMLTELLSRR